MFVYSGRCKFCETGISTGFRDIAGKALFTGDIVIVFTDDFTPDALTVMVQDQLGEVLGKDDRPFFAMGILSCAPVQTEEETIFTSEDSDAVWHVRKVKDFSDVVDGEHWKAYGFRYSNE